MVDRFRDRIKILEDQEIEELYGRPQFNHDERLHFFSLSPEERALADAHHNLADSVPFVLQLGYFKARTMFFVFEFRGCKPKPAKFIQHLKSTLYCKSTLARMASRSIGCCLSRNA